MMCKQFQSFFPATFPQMSLLPQKDCGKLFTFFKEENISD